MNLNNLLYYSTNTLLAHRICIEFYNGSHYVWCSPVYNSETLDKLHPWAQIPESSNPYKIYARYLKDVQKADMHSALIKQNRRGIIRGAQYNYEKDIIDQQDLARITQMVKKADITKFIPMLYLIPAHIIKDRIKKVDVSKQANPLSIEYQIPDLKTEEFEIISHH